MQKNSLDTEINGPQTSFLDTVDFVPINPNWRKKYYRKVLKKRVSAFLLDIFFSSVIGLISYFLIASPVVALLEMFSSDLWDKVALNFPVLFFFFVYATMFLPLGIMESSKWKGTVGKRIMKIQITDNYGNPISFGRSFWRNILKILFFFSYIFIIPAIVQYFTYKKTGKFFHDYFSQTIIGERL